jgi:hypothetical protein
VKNDFENALGLAPLAELNRVARFFLVQAYQNVKKYTK